MSPWCSIPVETEVKSLRDNGDNTSMGSSDVGVTVVEYEGANVGQARALGCGVLLDEFRDSISIVSGWRPLMPTPACLRLAARSHSPARPRSGRLGRTSHRDGVAATSTGHCRRVATSVRRRRESHTWRKFWHQRPELRRRRRLPVASLERRPRPASRARGPRRTRSLRHLRARS